MTNPPVPLFGDYTPFATLLKAGRRRRRLSQLELAVDAAVSQRHLSFLESGRAKPSRAMILQLCEALEIPLRERNDWLVAAGFAPMFHARALEDPRMEHVLGAVDLMLGKHAPFPALALDRAWDIVRMNTPFARFIGLLGEDPWTPIGGCNLLRLMFHPRGLRPLVTNWPACGPLLWQRALREAHTPGGAAMLPVLDALRPHVDAAQAAIDPHAPLLPILTVDLALNGLHASLFTVIATFGTPQDVTADELRIEFLFPADAATERLLNQLAGA